MSGSFAYVTLATNESYALGALVLGHSLMRTGTSHKLVAIITKDVPQSLRVRLASVFHEVREVDPFDSSDSAHLALLGRPDLGITFTKLHAWKLTEYSKCVFLDADMLVLQSIDELFEREELSAVPDVGWPDYFNTGLFVYRPSLDTYSKLVQFALKHGSFDGGDQGVLNAFFSDWAQTDIQKHLSFVYNCVQTSFYTYLPALKRNLSNVKVLHFIGALKPWNYTMDASTGVLLAPPGTPANSQHHSTFLRLWWSFFVQHVHSSLTELHAAGALSPSSLAGRLGQLHLASSARNVLSVTGAFHELHALFEPAASAGHAGATGFTGGAHAEAHSTSVAQKQEADAQTRAAWEHGHVDYTGSSSFENIKRHMEEVISSGTGKASAPSAPPAAPTAPAARDAPAKHS